MEPCIAAVKENVEWFTKVLGDATELGGEIPLMDWRVAVYGYRDYEWDGDAEWLVANPFTRNPEAIREQLRRLEATGGGDMPEDLLDALHKPYLFAGYPYRKAEG